MKAIVIPVVLFIYLVVMMVMGWPSYCEGLTSPMLYFGGSALCLCCIVLLHFHLKRTARRRKQ